MPLQKPQRRKRELTRAKVKKWLRPLTVKSLARFMEQEGMAMAGSALALRNRVAQAASSRFRKEAKKAAENSGFDV